MGSRTLHLIQCNWHVLTVHWISGPELKVRGAIKPDLCSWGDCRVERRAHPNKPQVRLQMVLQEAFDKMFILDSNSQVRVRLRLEHFHLYLFPKRKIFPSAGERRWYREQMKFSFFFLFCKTLDLDCWDGASMTAQSLSLGLKMKVKPHTWVLYSSAQ